MSKHSKTYKPSKGNSKHHGQRVKQNSGLNRAILDYGWGEFSRQLGYKFSWNAGMMLAVAPHNNSRTCPSFDHVSKDNRPTQAKFLYVDCGYENYADVVGEIIIIERVHPLLACTETVQSVRSKKQEPNETTRKSSRSAEGILVL